VDRHPWNRLLAWGVDWLGILGWVAILAAVGIPLYLSGVTAHLSLAVLNLIAALVLVVPVTLGLAGLESGRREASPGKRALHLRVVRFGTGAPVSWWRALGRNTLKVAVPWIIGHAAVYSIVASGGEGTVPAPVWLLTAVAYVLPIAYVVTLFIGSGRTPYDRIAGTAVVR
jgi:uncharacterized RDD family membrane protein YckC